MNEELKKLLDAIKNKKQEIRDLCAAEKITEAAAAKDEIKALQEKLNYCY